MYKLINIEMTENQNDLVINLNQELTFHDLLDLHFDGGHFSGRWFVQGALDSMNRQTPVLYRSHIIIL